jgi:hypothetical protein
MSVYERGGYDGIFIALPPERTINGGDLDNCLNPDSKEILSPNARRVVTRLNTYTEYSPSGRGLRTLGLGRKPDSANSRKGDIELYDNRRFLSVTGHHYEGTPTTINDCTEALTDICFELWPETPLCAEPRSDSEPQEPAGGNALLPADDTLLKIAKRTNGKFQELYDTEVLISERTDNTGKPVFSYQSSSEADAGLIFELAFWTNGDAERVRRLALNSKRLRGKWNDKRGISTWLDNEINNALDVVKEGFEDADVIAYLDRTGRVNVDRAVKELLAQHHFLTFDDTEEIYQLRGGVHEENGEAFIKQEVQRLLKHKTTNHLVNEIMNAVRRLTFVRREEAQAPLNLIPVRNGVLDVKTGAVVPWNAHDPNAPFFFKHQGAYIPELLLEDTITKSFFNSTFPTREGESELPIIQEFAGSCFYRKSLYKK